MPEIAAILRCKCPKCKEGNLFKAKNIYTFRSMLDTNPSCPKCGQDFTIEPGFYLGAMWVSYPFVLVSFLIFIGISYFFSKNLIAAFCIAAIIELLLLPLFVRIGRSLWLHLNV